MVQSKLRFKYERQHTYYDRKVGYVRRIFYDLQYAKEIRIFNIQDILLDIYNAASSKKIASIKTKGGNWLS
jgi:ATP-binding cassette subfamily B protein